MDLRSEKSKQMTFGQLLKIIIDEVERNFGMKVLLQIESDALLPEKVELALSRIARECLINAGKHANASMVEVQFDGMLQQALLKVKDNGKGFEPDQPGSGQMGLQIMNERIEQIGGTLDVVSKPTIGTTLTAVWIEDADGQED